MTREPAMPRGDRPTPAQRRRAALTAVVLALAAAAIYFTFMLGFAR